MSGWLTGLLAAPVLGESGDFGWRLVMGIARTIAWLIWATFSTRLIQELFWVDIGVPLVV